MWRMAKIALVCLIFVVPVQAQLSQGAQNLGIFHYGLSASATRQPFIEPAEAGMQLQRQVCLQFLPDGFIPVVETEKDPTRRKALRYAIAYYQDCQVAGFPNSVDVLIGLRIELGGPLKVKYFRAYTVIQPTRLQFQEERSAMAILAQTEGSALLFFKAAERQLVINFEGLFESPHAASLLAVADLAGIKTDESIQQYILVVRGGRDRASVFAINVDPLLQQFKSYELFRDLSSSDATSIFEILPPTTNNRQK
ncbi:MAG: hypothetical protein AB1489_33650 [Acidobacteriota bacterium]